MTSPEITDAMVEAAALAYAKACGKCNRRGIRSAPSALVAEPAPVAWPSGFFAIGGGCGQHVSIRVERDGVGSEHCEPCARKIAEFVDQQAAPAREGK